MPTHVISPTSLNHKIYKIQNKREKGKRGSKALSCRRTMACLANSSPVHGALLSNSSTSYHQLVFNAHSHKRKFPLQIRAYSIKSENQEKLSRRQVLTLGTVAANVIMLQHNQLSFAAEGKKGFLYASDKKDGYSFLYPFGWQEVVVQGQDKVFKDVIEPLESVSVNLIPTAKQDIRELGSPQVVAETLVKKVLAPPSQTTKLIEASEHEIDGKAYYTFEFTAQAPNFTRHALGTVSIANGKFYTLTTGANERRWEKMKDRLHEVVDSFKIETR